MAFIIVVRLRTQHCLEKNLGKRVQVSRSWLLVVGELEV